MPFDSSGVFDRVIPGGWQADRDAGTKITAVRHDAEDDGFATGLSTCITRTGVSTILADIPWNHKKITQLGEPTNAEDAATKNYVDNFKEFTTGAVISGAGPINGFLTFTSPTGVNGIGWATADMSWIGRVAVEVQSTKRLAVNNAKDGTGADVFSIDEVGRVNSQGSYGNNLSHDPDTADWRTPVLGVGTLFEIAAGALRALSNDVATTVAHQVAVMRQFFKVYNNDGSVILELNKSASAKVSGIRGNMADKVRWLMYLGNQTAETATDRVGSDFGLHSYNNLGTVLHTELTVNRLSHKWTFGGEIYAPLVTTSQNFDSVSTVCILSATSGGTIRLRPDGPLETSTSVMITSLGGISIAEGDSTPLDGVYAGYGIKAKAGMTGGYVNYWMNSVWNGSVCTLYANNTPMGNVAWACDYRIKKNIKALPSTWDAVKALKPISYQQKAYDIWESDDQVRWGFVAHELQERLTESAASGVKDGKDVQSPNMMVVIAALTRALQEAQARIEALEARP